MARFAASSMASSSKLSAVDDQGGQALVDSAAMSDYGT
jgi:hypothetical protein